MFGLGYFASNADEYFMVLNNPNFSLGIIDDNPEKYKVRNQFGVATMPRKGVVMLSSLLPPPEAISAYLDGRPNDGANIYYNFLNNDNTCQNIISVLLKLFYTGRSIVLFIPRDEVTSINFISVFRDYLFDMFGVKIGDIRNINTAFVNPNIGQYANMINCLYLYDNLSFMDFCMQYPDNCVMSDSVSNKIVIDNKINIDDIANYFGKPTTNLNMNDIENYASAYTKSIRDNTRKGIMNTNKQYRKVITRNNKKESDSK